MREVVRFESLVSTGDLSPKRGVAHAFGLPALRSNPRLVTVRPESCETIQLAHPKRSLDGCGGGDPSDHRC